MKLGIRDRIVLLNILPAEGDFITLKIVHDLRSALAFSEQDLKDYEITSEDNAVRWSEAKEAELGQKEIEIGPKALSVIVELLKKLSEAGKLVEGNLSVYEKFM